MKKAQLSGKPSRYSISESEYSGFHSKLRRINGKANKCENADCNKPNAKRFEWALIKGRKYSSDRKDYIQLCSSCHRKYDETEERKRKISENHKGVIYNDNRRVVVQLDQKGNKINEFPSVMSASKNTGILRTSIMNCLSGRSSNSGGFLWKYK
jgi:hypothetical protein